MVIKNTNRLAELGPIDPRTGFPLWYEDATGLRLELVWKPGDENAPVDLDDGSGPLRAIDPFPGEVFYQLAEARMVSAGGPRNGRVRVVLALEATFGGTGDVADGQQIVFARTRFRIDDAVPLQTYTLTHPYGVMEAAADEKGRVFVTEDIGVTPLAFGEALGGGIAPFLRWTSDPGLDAARYIGDGQTAHTIQKTPHNGDHVLVEGPGIAPAGGRSGPPGTPFDPDRLYTDLFVLQGRVATLNGAEITRSVHTRDAGSVAVDVFALSVPGQSLAVSADSGPGTVMQGGAGASRSYFLRLGTGAVVPQKVTVRNETDPIVDPPLPPTEAGVPDAVEVTQADYDSAARTLTVAAVSSDRDAPPPLKLTGRGLPETVLDVPGPTTLSDLDAPPPTITVTSQHADPARNGSGERAVTVVG